MSKNIPVGLDQLHYAIMTDEALETYDTPKRIFGAVQATITPTVNNATFFADDIAYDTTSAMGDITVALTVADVPTEDQAALLGHEIDENGGLDQKSTDVAPYVAIGYRRRMANGNFRYVWLYKGKFTLGAEDANTKTDTPTYQPPSLNAVFISRMTDERWRYSVTQGDDGVTPEFLETFFDDVYVPETVPTP